MKGPIAPSGETLSGKGRRESSQHRHHRSARKETRVSLRAPWTLPTHLLRNKISYIEAHHGSQAPKVALVELSRRMTFKQAGSFGSQMPPPSCGMSRVLAQGCQHGAQQYPGELNNIGNPLLKVQGLPRRQRMEAPAHGQPGLLSGGQSGFGFASMPQGTFGFGPSGPQLSKDFLPDTPGAAFVDPQLTNIIYDSEGKPIGKVDNYGSLIGLTNDAWRGLQDGQNVSDRRGNYSPQHASQDSGSCCSPVSPRTITMIYNHEAQ